MRLYLWFITIVVVIIAAVVSIVYSVSFLPTWAFAEIAAILAIIINGLTATVVRLMPQKVADPNKKRFQVSAGEKKFYEKLQIRKWKEKVPELGHLTGFRKNKVDKPNDVAYLDRFLLECCYGEMGHFTSIFTSFLLPLLYPKYDLWLAVSIPIAIVSALMNLPSYMILRYNSYKLRVLRQRLINKQNRAQEGEQPQEGDGEEITERTGVNQ